MGRRSQPRKQIEVEVRIFGTDSQSRVSSEKVVTVNISRKGTELAGVRPELGLDEIVGLTYGTNRGHFRVKWIGEPGTTNAGCLGLLSIDGCYVEIPIPLELGKRLKVGIWFGQSKAWADGRVTHSVPGLGIGIRFTEISESNLDQIRRFLETLSPLARKAMRPIAPLRTNI